MPMAYGGWAVVRPLGPWQEGPQWPQGWLWREGPGYQRPPGRFAAPTPPFSRHLW